MWLIVLLGCRDAQVDDFLDARAAAICARHTRCGTLEDANYADEADCLDTIAESDAAAGAVRCEGFDPDAADACLAAFEGDCTTPPDLGVCANVCQ